MGCLKTKKPSDIDSNIAKLPIINIEGALDNHSTESIQLSSFVSEINCITLETNKNCLIGNRPYFFMTDNHIFYNELMFDKNGKFVRKIGKIGKGPGEYVFARKVSINEERREFYVYDNFQHRIMVYDLDNNFLKSFKVSELGDGLFPVGENYLLMLYDRFQILPEIFDYCILDSNNGNIVRFKKSLGLKKLPVYTDCFALFHNVCWYYDSKLSYYEILSDTIFQIMPDKEIPRYIVNLGKYKVPIDKITSIKSGDEVLRIWSISESTNYLFFRIITKGFKEYYGIFDKIKKDTRVMESEKAFNNDIDGGPNYFFQNSITGNTGFFSLTPIELKKNLILWNTENKNYNSIANSKFNDFVSKLDDNQNHIIVLYTLK